MLLDSAVRVARPLLLLQGGAQVWGLAALLASVLLASVRLASDAVRVTRPMLLLHCCSQVVRRWLPVGSRAVGEMELWGWVGVGVLGVLLMVRARAAQRQAVVVAKV